MNLSPYLGISFNTEHTEFTVIPTYNLNSTSNWSTITIKYNTIYLISGYDYSYITLNILIVIDVSDMSDIRLLDEPNLIKEWLEINYVMIHNFLMQIIYCLLMLCEDSPMPTINVCLTTPSNGSKWKLEFL